MLQYVICTCFLFITLFFFDLQTSDGARLRELEILETELRLNQLIRKEKEAEDAAYAKEQARRHSPEVLQEEMANLRRNHQVAELNAKAKALAAQGDVAGLVQNCLASVKIQQPDLTKDDASFISGYDWHRATCYHVNDAAKEQVLDWLKTRPGWKGALASCAADGSNCTFRPRVPDPPDPNEGCD